MKNYLDLLREVIENGIESTDRTGTGTKSIFGASLRFDLSKGFPLLTTKKMYTKAIFHELIWMLKGHTNIKYLVNNDVHIWSQDAYRYYKEVCDLQASYIKRYNDKTLSPSASNYVGRFLKIYKKTKLSTNSILPPNLSFEEFIEGVKASKSYSVLSLDIKGDDITNTKYTLGDLGNVYGAQWRSIQVPYSLFKIDQINVVIEAIKAYPTSRRHLISAWNVSELSTMALPPCHYSFQFYSRNNKLSLLFNMRSTDICLGLPFNIASYGALLHIIARLTNHEVGELIFNGGDVHIYNNHLEGALEQLKRSPMELCQFKLSDRIKEGFDIDKIEYSDFEIVGYDSHPTIKFPLSVGL